MHDNLTIQEKEVVKLLTDNPNLSKIALACSLYYNAFQDPTYIPLYTILENLIDKSIIYEDYNHLFGTTYKLATYKNIWLKYLKDNKFLDENNL